MKRKSYFRNLLYLLIIILMIALEVLSNNYFINQAGRTYRLSAFIYIIPIFCNTIIGIVLGFESFINEITKPGKIKISIPKIMFMVIPSLYFSFSTIFNSLNNHFISNIIFYLSKNVDMTVTAICQIILGYSLITCINRHSL